MLLSDNFCEQVDEAMEVLDRLTVKFISFSKILKESTSFWLMLGLSTILCKKLRILARRADRGIDSIPNYFWPIEWDRLISVTWLENSML